MFQEYSNWYKMKYINICKQKNIGWEVCQIQQGYTIAYNKNENKIEVI
jgi:hypothetical protein